MDKKILDALKEVSKKYQDMRRKNIWDRHEKGKSNGNVPKGDNTTEQSGK